LPKPVREGFIIIIISIIIITIIVVAVVVVNYRQSLRHISNIRTMSKATYK